jgi:hypothetical protein
VLASTSKSVAMLMSKAASDLGLTTLMIAGTILTLFALAPWKSMGLSLRKLGFIEFEQVINAQAKERITDFTELRNRIEKLEGSMGNSINSAAGVAASKDNAPSPDASRADTAEPSTMDRAQDKLGPLLVQFLRQYRTYAFSPARIQKWGSQRPGYETFGTQSASKIRQALQQLVLTGDVTTRVSQHGNTLYKASR